MLLVLKSVQRNRKEVPSMRIVIVGCGKIGQSILKSLLRENHEIVAVDIDPDVISAISGNYDVMGICGAGTHFKTLSDAMVKNAELFIATTGSDELNMLSCFLAKRMGAKHTVARIRGQEYSEENIQFLKRQLELSMVINPEQLTAQTIFNILKFPSAVRSETFTRRRFEMAELSVKPGSALDGVSLSELRQRYSAAFLVCAVLRGEKAYIPGGSFVLEAGDKLGLLAAPEDMQKLLRGMGILQKSAKHVMILGGSRIAQYLAEDLIRGENSVKIIEKNEERCAELCGELPDNVLVICGDGSDKELLIEEGLDRADAFVSLTGIDEENLLVSYCALGRKVPKVIAKISQDSYSDVGGRLGIDCVVSPTHITADLLVQYARALENSLGSSVETLYSLMNGNVEALEFDVSDDFACAGVAIKELRLKSGVLLAGIIRGYKTIIPGGDDVILPRDRVIVIAAGQKLCDLSDVIA